MKEVILLAGGLGTRLRSQVDNTPKALAPIQDHVFLDYLFSYLETQWVDHVILALGYESKQILDWLKNKAFTFKVSTSLEQEPLGTGGAIKRALMKSKEKNVFVMNADTYFPINMQEFLDKVDNNFPICIALSKEKNPARYGKVFLDKNSIITKFEEKNTELHISEEYFYINAGTYFINKDALGLENFNEKFSWETEVLQKEAKNGRIQGIYMDVPFIDIGIPEDYKKAQTFIPNLHNEE